MGNRTGHRHNTDAIDRLQTTFPCWDEPDFKATFGITLVVRDYDTVFRTLPGAKRQLRADGLVAITFADTMIMSTYLVAFVVGPLEATEWRRRRHPAAARTHQVKVSPSLDSTSQSSA